MSECPERTDCPTEPNEVGDCAACRGRMYDYEKIECPTCGEDVHKGCLEACAKCKHVGCKACMVENEVGEWLDDECHREEQEEELRQRVINFGNHKDLDKYLKRKI